MEFQLRSVRESGERAGLTGHRMSEILPAASSYVPGRVKRSSYSSCGFSFPSDGFTLGLH